MYDKDRLLGWVSAGWEDAMRLRVRSLLTAFVPASAVVLPLCIGLAVESFAQRRPARVEEFQAQLLNYLRATRFEVGLLLNFGPEPQFRRRVFENARKGQPPRAQGRAGALHKFGGVPEI